MTIANASSADGRTFWHARTHENITQLPPPSTNSSAARPTGDSRLDCREVGRAARIELDFAGPVDLAIQDQPPPASLDERVVVGADRRHTAGADQEHVA